MTEFDRRDWEKIAELDGFNSEEYDSNPYIDDGMRAAWERGRRRRDEKITEQIRQQRAG